MFIDRPSTLLLALIVAVHRLISFCLLTAFRCLLPDLLLCRTNSITWIRCIAVVVAAAAAVAAVVVAAVVAAVAAVAAAVVVVAAAVVDTVQLFF